ncbi:cytochrome c oxidase assembly protein [Alteribacter salitolerans]|uniref:cytochrome c oxidase assembly protein n=1 Tax=Alteribacter salitolerans TaxID=2912333 RepID=UPI003AF89EA8
MIIVQHIHSSGHEIGVLPQVLLALPFVLAFMFYITCVVISRKNQRSWPVHRTTLWTLGILCALTAVIGPVAVQAHGNFTLHMLGHLLLGMIAPLLMVLAAPVTLLLRTFSVPAARKVTKVLKSKPLHLFTNPVFASILNMGGLWVLYTTNLFPAMHEHTWLHILIHFHVFLAGYLFTISMIYIDPMPHGYPYLYRGVVLVLALASHGILSKYIYANPPSGVAAADAQTGGMLMYYGGDAVDIIIIFILCLHWYRSARPKIPQFEKNRTGWKADTT